MPRGEQEVLFAQLASRLLAQGAAARVETAFLEMTPPSLGERLTQLAAEGLRRVAVIPAFAPFDRNVKRWLPRYLAFWKTEQGLDLDVVIGAEIEATHSFARSVCESIDLASRGADVRDTYKPLRHRQGLSRIPDYSRQIQMCLGPRCVMAGAWAVYDELRRSLQTGGLDKPGPQRVIPVRTACLQPCNFAPVCAVQPDDIWYGELTPKRIGLIVRQHLVEGRPVEDFAYRPGDRIRSAPHEADVLESYPVVGAEAGEILVKDAFVRPAMKLLDAAAVFMCLENTGVVDDRLLAVQTPRSPLPRIHDASRGHGELERMPFEPLIVPAVSTVELRPGGLHLMLLQFRGELVEGIEVPVELSFERAGRVQLNLTMHPPAGGMAGMA